MPDGLDDVTAIAAGVSHSLALRSDGTVTAWSPNPLAQSKVPDGLTDVTAIAADAEFNLALRRDGTVTAWGDNRSRQSSVPDGLTGVTAIAAGAVHSLAVGPRPVLLTDAPSAQAKVDAPYSYAFTATSGSPSFSAPEGTIPPGLVLSQAGVLSGTPTEAGTFTVAVAATNLFDTTKGQPHTITVALANTAPTVTLEGIADGSRYEFGQVPIASCLINDLEDGPSTAPAALTGTLEHGLGSQTATCEHTDTGGQTARASGTYTIVDTGVPVITAAFESSPNDARWFRAPLTIYFSCFDTFGSGIRDCLTPQTLTEGVNQSVTGTATDHAGNTSNVTFDRLDVDVTAPTVSFTRTPAASYVFGTDIPTPTCAATDALSGLAGNCTVTGGEITLGEHTFTATATDVAGNSATTTATYTVIAPADTAPTVTVTGVESAARYELRRVPAASCAISDLEDGPSTTPATLTGMLEFGLGSQTATCEHTDAGGHLAQASVTYTIVDTVAPTITAATTPRTPNAAGWFRAPVRVAFTCADTNGSGIRDCTPATILTDGADQSAPGTATDHAGNTAESTIDDLDIDTTKPVVAFDRKPAASYPYAVKIPTPTCTATDALSGIDGRCTVTGGGTAVGKHTYTATATDKAGNTSVTTTSYTVTPWTLKGLLTLWKKIKAGSQTPVAFEVFSQVLGRPGTLEHTALADVKSVTQKQTACAGKPALTGMKETTATGALRYNTTTGQYAQDWKAPVKTGTCWTLTITMLDGTTGTATYTLN